MIKKKRFNEADSDYLKIGNTIYPKSIKFANSSMEDVKRAYDKEQAEKAEAERQAVLKKEEAERQATFKKKADEIRAKANEVETSEEDSLQRRIDKYFEVLVPPSGKCETVAGELLRAICKLRYRWWNDGDYFYEGYGIETCSKAAAFIDQNGTREMGLLLERMMDIPTDEYNEHKYEKALDKLTEMILDYLDTEDGIFSEETIDMYDTDDRSYIREPLYDYDFEIDYSIKKYINSGYISDKDVCYNVESLLGEVGVYDADISIFGNTVEVYDINR